MAVSYFLLQPPSGMRFMIAGTGHLSIAARFEFDSAKRGEALSYLKKVVEELEGRGPAIAAPPPMTAERLTELNEQSRQLSLGSPAIVDSTVQVNPQPVVAPDTGGGTVTEPVKPPISMEEIERLAEESRRLTAMNGG